MEEGRKNLERFFLPFVWQTAESPELIDFYHETEWPHLHRRSVVITGLYNNIVKA